MRPRRSLAGARVLVTGGAGFVGSWLCERLLGDGAMVWCVDSSTTGAPDTVEHLVSDSGFTLVEADVSSGVPDPGDLDLVTHLPRPESPGHDLHLPLETLGAASRGTVHALELAERHGARFLLASTSEVYVDVLHSRRERCRGSVDTIGPRSVHDEAKRFAEATTMAYHRGRGVDVAIARIFDTYGPRMSLDDGLVVPTLLEQALSGVPVAVAGDGSQIQSPCWIEDAVDALVRLACSTERGPVDLGNDTETTVLELARTVVEVTGSRSPIRHVELPQDHPKVRRPDTDFARRALGWTPTTGIEHGLTQTMRWMEEMIAA